MPRKRFVMPKFPAADYADEADRVRAETNRLNETLENCRIERETAEAMARIVDRMIAFNTSEKSMNQLVDKIKSKQGEW